MRHTQLTRELEQLKLTCKIIEYTLIDTTAHIVFADTLMRKPQRNLQRYFAAVYPQMQFVFSTQQ